MAARHSLNDRGILAWLVLLIFLGCLPRFWGLTETGPYFVDQGEYMLEARWVHQVTSSIIQAIPSWIQDPPESPATELRRIFGEAEGHPMAMGRPLHILLAAVLMFFLGYSPYLGNAVSATFGILSIPAVFLLYRRLFGPRGALAASAVLAFMGVHVYYSRNFFPETDSTFFLLVSLLLYIRSRETAPEKGVGWIALCGLAWGLAVTTSDRWLSMVIILWLLEGHLLLWERRVTWRQAFRRVVVLHAALLLPIVAVELPYVAVRAVFWIEGESMPFQSYLRILAKHFLIAQAMTAIRFVDVLPMSGFRFSDLLIFPYISVQYNGLLYSGFLLIGIARSLWVRRFGDLVVLCCILLPILYLQLQAYHCMRHYSITFPFIAILAARGLSGGRSLDRTQPNSALPGGRRWWSLPLAGLFCLTLASGVYESIKAMRFPFGYREATRYIEERGWKVFSTNEWVFQSYLSEKVCQPSPEAHEDLTEGRQVGYRHLVVDYHPVVWELIQEMGVKHEKNSRRLSVVRDVIESAKPVATFSNPGAGTPDLTFEVLFHYEDAFAVADRIRSVGGDVICIYEIPEPSPVQGRQRPRPIGKGSP